MTIVRPASLDDDASLARISYESWDESNHPGARWHRDRPFFGPPSDARVVDVVVAVDGGGVVGYIRIQPSPSIYGDWYIADLGVAPEARSRGVGRALIRSALQRAESAEASAVWLKVLSTNEAGLALYRSVGFREVGRLSQPFTTRPGTDDLRFSVQVQRRAPTSAEPIRPS